MLKGFEEEGDVNVAVSLLTPGLQVCSNLYHSVLEFAACLLWKVEELPVSIRDCGCS